ncbi:MAG: hypothetical protein Q8P38_01725 [Candidatus Nanopelagicales bacterium]|nr:hypothetical protein [Candidatus Nanopelagicales bacterium]
MLAVVTAVLVVVISVGAVWMANLVFTLGFAFVSDDQDCWPGESWESSMADLRGLVPRSATDVVEARGPAGMFSFCVDVYPDVVFRFVGSRESLRRQVAENAEKSGWNPASSEPRCLEKTIAGLTTHLFVHGPTRRGYAWIDAKALSRPDPDEGCLRAEVGSAR